MKNLSAFSLVELSIVLVILGLLTGGILSGQSLIRAAELRSVTTEYQRHTAALYSFRDRYQAIPGDFKDATKFWTAAHTTLATCITTAATGKETCDGDGNGRIDAHHEKFRFWQHLANAGLIEGSYSGIYGSPGLPNDSTIGVNTPASRLSNAGWHSAYADASAASGTTFTIDFGNHYLFGSDGGTSGSLGGEALRPEELWNIDTKIDDGRPGYGLVIAQRWATCTTATANTMINVDYNLASNSIGCAIRFAMRF